jgi:hypothetical protein
VSEDEQIWLPLVDEPIGEIVGQIQAEHEDIARLVERPHRILAFKTFAYIRVGILLGQLLMENELDPYDGSGTWVDQLLENPEYKQQIIDEVRTVAEEIAADPRYADDEPLGPDEAARERFRAFARERLEST